MSGDASVLVTLDGAVRDPGSPLLTGDDLAAVRGDGVFETLLIREGAACLVESHLRRLVSSAVMLEPFPYTLLTQPNKRMGLSSVGPDR